VTQFQLNSRGGANVARRTIGKKNTGLLRGGKGAAGGKGCSERVTFKKTKVSSPGGRPKH